MSEYQYYEFQAIDRALTTEEMKRVRNTSTRATITKNSFINVYSYGDFKGDPDVFLEKYFDAFLYVANWGDHDVTFRIPAKFMGIERVKPYISDDEDDAFSYRTKDDFVFLGFKSREEAGSWEEGDEYLADLLPIRSELMSGDFRSLYLGWLLRVQIDEVDENSLEPPVPAGLGDLSDAQKSLITFLRLDPDLVEVASKQSQPKIMKSFSEKDFGKWLASLAQKQKDDWLIELMKGKSQLQFELIRNFESHAGLLEDSGEPENKEKRTVEQLLRETKNLAETKKKIAVEQKKEARTKYLKGLAQEGNKVWGRLDEMVNQKRPDYKQIIKLINDFKDAYLTDAQPGEFLSRFKEFREQYKKKSSLMREFKEAGLKWRSF